MPRFVSLSIRLVRVEALQKPFLFIRVFIFVYDFIVRRCFHGKIVFYLYMYLYLSVTLLFVDIFMIKALWLGRWIPNPWVPGSKPLGGSRVDSVFHLSEVDQMSTRTFWGLSGKK